MLLQLARTLDSTHTVAIELVLEEHVIDVFILEKTGASSFEFGFATIQFSLLQVVSFQSAPAPAGFFVAKYAGTNSSRSRRILPSDFSRRFAAIESIVVGGFGLVVDELGRSWDCWEGKKQDNHFTVLESTSVENT